MSEHNNNTKHTDLCAIEKYSGSFDQDDLGVTQIPTETILAIRNTTDLALFCFLASRPKTWRLNAKHLADHFDCHKEKIYKSLDSLITQGFLTRTLRRDKGRFAQYHYRLHLRKIDTPGIDTPLEPPAFSPCPEKPDTEKPYAYKTKNIENMEDNNKTPIVDSSKSTTDRNEIGYSQWQYKEDPDFMLWYSGYPNKQKPNQAYKAWKKLKPDQKLQETLVEDVCLRAMNNWAGRAKSMIPHPATYLNSREWEGEIVPQEEKARGQTSGAIYDHDDTSWLQGVL